MGVVTLVLDAYCKLAEAGSAPLATRLDSSLMPPGIAIFDLDTPQTVKTGLHGIFTSFFENIWPPPLPYPSKK